MGRQKHFVPRNETAKFNRDFILFLFPFFPPSFWGWVSLTRNIGEKHSFFQLCFSVGFPIRNYGRPAALHFVIMTGKNEFLMWYLCQLQVACGSSVTRHSESNEPELRRRASPENITSRWKKKNKNYSLSLWAQHGDVVHKDKGKFTNTHWTERDAKQCLLLSTWPSHRLFHWFPDTFTEC